LVKQIFVKKTPQHKLKNSYTKSFEKILPLNEGCGTYVLTRAACIDECRWLATKIN